MNLAKAWLDVTEDPEEGIFLNLIPVLNLLFFFSQFFFLFFYNFFLFFFFGLLIFNICFLFVANYQKERVYWKRICEKFLFLERKEEGYREPDSLSSKWRKMRPHIQAFNQIHNRRTRANNHQSGESDADVVKSCLQEYQGIYGKPFTFLPIWDKIRNSSKFHYVTDFDVLTSRGQPSSKRSKTSSSAEPQSQGVSLLLIFFFFLHISFCYNYMSYIFMCLTSFFFFLTIQGSDARVNIDLNSFDEEDDEPVFQERVRGRDAARRASFGGSSGSSGKGKGKYTETFESLSGKLDGLMNISKERLGLGKEKMEMEKAKQTDRQNVIKLAELKVLTTDYSHLGEPERSIMMKAQEDIRAKHGIR